MKRNRHLHLQMIDPIIEEPNSPIHSPKLKPQKSLKNTSHQNINSIYKEDDLLARGKSKSVVNKIGKTKLIIRPRKSRDLVISKSRCLDLVKTHASKRSIFKLILALYQAVPLALG